MRLSYDKILHISHLITKGLAEHKGIKFLCDDNNIRLEIVKIITNELKIDDQIDQSVRKKLDSYSRKIIEGTQEWEHLYHKLRNEELVRLGRK